MKRLNIRQGLLLVCLSISQLSLAQTSSFAPDPRLTDLVRQMERFYPPLQIQQQQQLVAKLQTEVAKAAGRPAVNGLASYNYATPVSLVTLPIGPTDRTLQLQPHNNYNAQLTASYTLTDFGRTQLAIQRAGQNEQVVNLSSAALHHNVSYQLASTYYNLLFTNRAIAVKDTEIVQIQRTSALTSHMLKDGTSLDYDTLVADVRLKMVYIQRTDLLNQQQKLIVILNSLTGSDNQALSKATTDFRFHEAPSDDEAVVQAAFQANPDLRTQQAQQQLSHYDVATASRAFLPTIQLTGSAGYRNGFAPDVNQIRANTLVGATASIPIYTGERNHNQLNISRANESIAQLTTNNTANNVRRDVLSALSELRTLGEKYNLVLPQVEQVRQALVLANARYRSGILRPIDVTDAQNNYIQVLQIKVQFEYQLQMADLQLHQLLSQPVW